MRFYILDIIRFCAAFAVVLYHYTARQDSSAFTNLSTITKYGYLGVPLFFIISGFVISLSAHSRTAAEFAISRFVRLYPAFWVGVTFTTVVVIFYGGQIHLSQYITNLTMLNDYIGYANIDGVYWTLQAELKFYACVFCLLVLGIFNNIRIWLGVWMLATISYLLIEQPFFMGWFISPFYSSFFIAGVTFYLFWKEGGNWFNISVLILSLVVSSIYAYQQAASFMVDPGNSSRITAIIVVLGFYGMFLMLVRGKLNIKSSNLLVILGGLTYPLYLIHSKAGKIIIDHYKQYFAEEVLVVIVILLMLITSFLMHFYLERRLSTPLKLFLLNNVSKFTSIKNLVKNLVVGK